MRKDFVWKKSDLSNVLDQGDLLYKLFNTCHMLSVDVVPRSIKSVQIQYLELETKIATITDDDPFPRNIVPLLMVHY